MAYMTLGAKKRAAKKRAKQIKFCFFYCVTCSIVFGYALILGQEIAR